MNTHSCSKSNHVLQKKGTLFYAFSPPVEATADCSSLAKPVGFRNYPGAAHRQPVYSELSTFCDRTRIGKNPRSRRSFHVAPPDLQGPSLPLSRHCTTKTRTFAGMPPLPWAVLARRLRMPFLPSSRRCRMRNLGSRRQPPRLLRRSSQALPRPRLSTNHTTRRPAIFWTTAVSEP